MDKIPKTWSFGLKAKKATIQEELKETQTANSKQGVLQKNTKEDG